MDQRLEVPDVSRAPVVLVAFVSLAVVAYALGYGEPRGRSRMVGLLLVFSGAMEPFFDLVGRFSECECERECVRSGSGCLGVQRVLARPRPRCPCKRVGVGLQS